MNKIKDLWNSVPVKFRWIILVVGALSLSQHALIEVNIQNLLIQIFSASSEQ